MHLVKRAAIAMALMVGVVVAVAAGAGSAAPSRAAGTTVSVAIPNDLGTMDPVTSGGDQGENIVFNALYDTLTGFDDTTGKITPELATSWMANANNTRFVFHVRKDAVCTDGHVLTPGDMATSIAYSANPKTANGYQSLIYGTAGVKSVRANNGAGTLTITLKAPWAALLAGLTGPQAAIVCPSGLANTKKLATAPEGSGPYKLVSSTPGNQYVVQLRPGYKGLPSGTSIAKMPTTITYKLVSDSTTVANLLLTGGLTAGSISTGDYLRVRATKKFFETKGQGYGADALMWNESAGHPGLDPRVRKALDVLIDRTKATPAFSNGNGTPISTLITPGMECYDAADASAAPKYSPTNAAALLESAGYTKDSGKWQKSGSPLKVTLIGFSDQNSGPAYIQQVWSNFGIDATTLVGTAGHNALHAGSYDADVFELNSPTIVPELLVNQLDGPYPGNSINFGHVANKAFEKIIQPAASATEAARCALWHTGEKALMQQADAYPIQANAVSWFGSGLKFKANFWAVDARSMQLTGK